MKKLDTEYADNFYFKLSAILKKAKEKKAEGVGPRMVRRHECRAKANSCPTIPDMRN